MRSNTQTPSSNHGGIPLGQMMMATFERNRQSVEQFPIFRDSKLEREQRVNNSFLKYNL